jgi:hypothetical protein
VRYADVENLWSVDLTLLSNAHRAKVYTERARQVVRDALANPEEKAMAVAGKRFRRAYLISRVGCQPSVTTQNPKVRALLEETDAQLARAVSSQPPVQTSGGTSV